MKPEKPFPIPPYSTGYTFNVNDIDVSVMFLRQPIPHPDNAPGDEVVLPVVSSVTLPRPVAISLVTQLAQALGVPLAPTN